MVSSRRPLTSVTLPLRASRATEGAALAPAGQAARAKATLARSFGGTRPRAAASHRPARVRMKNNHRPPRADVIMRPDADRIFVSTTVSERRKRETKKNWPFLCASGLTSARASVFSCAPPIFFRRGGLRKKTPLVCAPYFKTFLACRPGGRRDPFGDHAPRLV